MRSGVNKLLILIIIILVAVFAVRLRGGFFFGGDEVSDDIYSSMEELAERISEELYSGTDGKVVVYLKDISDAELRKINYYLDTMQGCVEEIVTSIYSTDLIKAELHVVRSDSSYALDSILNGTEIPADRVEAATLKRKAEDIISSCIRPGMSDFDKELAIHDYIVNHCTYGFYNDDSENEYSAYGALIGGRAVCSGYAAAMDLLLTAAGIDSRYVIGYADSEGASSDDSSRLGNVHMDNHAWNQVRIDGIWYNVDATWDDPVGKEEILSHKYFNVDDATLGLTHEWKKRGYETCSSMGANYFYKSGTVFYNAGTFKNYAEAYYLRGDDYILECEISGFDVGDDELQFLFDVNGIESISYFVDNMEDYRILTIYAK